MKTLKFATISLASLGVIIFAVLFFNGAFATVNVQKGSQGGYLLIGVDHIGSYQKIGDAFDKVKKIQLEEKYDSSLFVGVYFDDPASKPEDSLRSYAAFAVKDSAQALALMEKHPEMRMLNIPKENSFYTELETSGMLSMIIAAIKAYPALGDKIKEENPKTTGKGMAFEEYHYGFTRFVMQVR
jgi:hypothetical protein